MFASLLLCKKKKKKVAPARRHKSRWTEQATLFQATIVAAKDFTASQRDQFVCAVVKKGGAGTESLDIAWSSEYWATSLVVMDQSFSICKHGPHTSLAAFAVQEIRPQVGRGKKSLWSGFNWDCFSCINVQIAKHETLYADEKFEPWMRGTSASAGLCSRRQSRKLRNLN